MFSESYARARTSDPRNALAAYEPNARMHSMCIECLGARCFGLLAAWLAYDELLCPEPRSYVRGHTHTHRHYLERIITGSIYSAAAYLAGPGPAGVRTDRILSAGFDPACVCVSGNVHAHDEHVWCILSRSRLNSDRWASSGVRWWWLVNRRRRCSPRGALRVAL